MTVYHIPVQFTASRVGVDGLTVTWSVDRVTRADGTRSALVTDAANAVTYGRFGLYGYLLDMDLTTYDYLVTAKSTSAIVDMKELTTFWTTDPLILATISTETAGLATSAALGMVSSVVNTLPTAAEIDTQLSGTHGAGTWGNGSGSTSTTVTVNDGVNPIDGVDVWVSTDSAGTNVVARGSTGALGTVVFMLDAGTYYAWKQLAGYDFTNPQSFTVS